MPWGGRVADTLDQDVQALKDWLRSAWRYVGDPSLTRFERRELRNLMRQADEGLRAGLQKLAARNSTPRAERIGGASYFSSASGSLRLARQDGPLEAGSGHSKLAASGRDRLRLLLRALAPGRDDMT